MQEKFLYSERSYKSGSIILKKDYHNYSSLVFNERCNMYISRTELCNLGLLFLSMLFSDKKSVSIELTNKETDIEYMNIETFNVFSPRYQLDFEQKPMSYIYSETEFSKYPFYVLKYMSQYKDSNLPSFWISNENKGNLEAEKFYPDIFLIMGNHYALAILSHFLLNASNPNHKTEYYSFENAPGKISTNMDSSEFAIHLIDNQKEDIL